MPVAALLDTRGCPVFYLFCAIVLSALTGCNSSPNREPAIGVAYAGPATLNLHKDIDPKSDTVAIVHHGDKLDITGQRRRWYKVRTAKGVEGWASDRELLDTAQMQRLHALAVNTAGLPSLGVATTFSTLNVHSEPSRQSTSFLQVKEKEQFDVIAHRVLGRTPPPKRELVGARPKVEKKAGKGKKASIPTPPPPDPPAPPSDWIELSRERDQSQPQGSQHEEKPGPRDDWTLIRISGGQTGWVLTSAIYFQIPDEVAQYAEGHRITSYFSLGKIRDGNLQKDIWLWTTAERLGEDHDFDSYRVFVWSLKHHRYETAYIQRRERGFFPVLAKTGEFSVCLENDDGSRVRKQYEMAGNAVHLAGEGRCPKMADAEIAPQELVTAAPQSPPVKESLAERAKRRIKGLFSR